MGLFSTLKTSKVVEAVEKSQKANEAITKVQYIIDRANKDKVHAVNSATRLIEKLVKKKSTAVTQLAAANSKLQQLKVTDESGKRVKLTMKSIEDAKKAVAKAEEELAMIRSWLADKKLPNGDVLKEMQDIHNSYTKAQDKIDMLKQSILS